MPRPKGRSKQMKFSLEEIKMLIEWWNGNVSGGAKLYRKLLRIKRQLLKEAK